MRADDADVLTDLIFGLSDEEPLRLEIELVYRAGAAVAKDQDEDIRTRVVALGGRIVSDVRIPDIAYHAILADVPVRAVRAIIDRSADGLAFLESIMHIRPQSIASSLDVSEAEPSDAGPIPQPRAEPIIAVLDGVPLAAHPLLSAHLIVDDQFGLQPGTPVADRIHGTAMASLIIHGNRNRPGTPLPRRIHLTPVLGSRDAFPQDRLIVDLIYVAILAMREGPAATAPGVLVVNPIPRQSPPTISRPAIGLGAAPGPPGLPLRPALHR